MTEIKEVKSKSYTLYAENGGWLGQIVITNDGFFASVTDWGNLSYAWRSFGATDFREFLCNLNVGYFGGKLANGLAYIVYTKKITKECDNYAAKILPALQSVLKQDLIDNPNW